MRGSVEKERERLEMTEREGQVTKQRSVCGHFFVILKSYGKKTYPVHPLIKIAMQIKPFIYEIIYSRTSHTYSYIAHTLVIDII